MKMSLRAAVALSATVLATLASAGSASPAQAASGQTLCGDHPTIIVCADVLGSRSAVTPHGLVQFAPSSTSATGCNLTVWTSFWNGKDYWESKRRTTSCNAALPRYNGAGNWLGLEGYTSGTTATEVRGNAVVNLYYNGSSSSTGKPIIANSWWYKL